MSLCIVVLPHYFKFHLTLTRTPNAGDISSYYWDISIKCGSAEELPSINNGFNLQVTCFVFGCDLYRIEERGDWFDSKFFPSY